MTLHQRHNQREDRTSSSVHILNSSAEMVPSWKRTIFSQMISRSIVNRSSSAPRFSGAKALSRARIPFLNRLFLPVVAAHARSSFFLLMTPAPSFWRVDVVHSASLRESSSLGSPRNGGTHPDGHVLGCTGTNQDCDYFEPIIQRVVSGVHRGSADLSSPELHIRRLPIHPSADTSGSTGGWYRR